MALAPLPPASMAVDLTADDYADFSAYVYKRPELRRRRYRSHLRFAVLMLSLIHI